MVHSGVVDVVKNGGEKVKYNGDKDVSVYCEMPRGH